VTVQTNNSVAIFPGNDVTTVFPFNFKFFESGDLVVLLINRATRVTQTLVLNSDYTVQGAGDADGGSVTTAVPPPTGNDLRISRELKITQGTSLRNQGKFLAETHEDVFDKQVMISQQLQEQIDRTVKVPVDGSGSGDELVEQLFDARDSAAQSANEAEAIADKFGDVDQAITAAGAFAQEAGAAAEQSADSASIAGVAEAQAAQSSGLAAVYMSSAQTASDAAQLSAVVYPDTVSGLGATAVGRYFSVVSADSFEYLVLYRNVSGAAVEQKRYPSALIDSRTVNQAKGFPFKQLSRGGVISPANPIFNNLILDVRVIGAETLIDGKYFRIAFFQNDSNIGGNVDQGIVIEQFEASSYLSTGTATIIHNHTDAPADIVRSGGVQTFVVTPAARVGLRFIITINAAFLPAAGSAINALTSERQHYSWIIDPNAYQVIGGLGSSLLVNKGSVYPQRKMTRAGVTSFTPAAFMSSILSAEVHGARAGKYYRLAYFKNGTTLLPGPDDGWMIEEIDALNYETDANAALIVVNYTDVGTPTLVRDGIQTIRLESTVVAGLSVKLSVDTAALPAFGTPIGSNQNFQAGYSYIIDPSNYTLAAAPTGSGDTMPVKWSISSNVLRVAWASAGRCFRMTFGLLGVNQLPNLITQEGAPGSDLSSAVWSQLSTTGSDYLPPFQVSADANGDGGAIAFTGGSHGSNGDATGSPTARNMLYRVYADDTAVSSGSGSAQCVNVQIVNEVQAHNTKTAGRYVLRQSFNINFRAWGMEVTADVHALEAVHVITDYALQAITGGWQDTQLVLGGGNASRVPFVSTQNNSGLKSANPNAWALVLQHPTNGQMTLWMDKGYEAGDGRYVDAGAPLLRGEATTKWYLGVVLPPLTGPAPGQAFAAGTGYKYRAGISWQGVGMQPVGYDSIVRLKQSAGDTFAYGLPDASFVKV